MIDILTCAFLGSASVYAEVTLALMNKYDWRQNQYCAPNGRIFFYHISQHFKMKLDNRINESSLGVDSNQKRSAKEAVEFIREKFITVTVLWVNQELAATILCTAYDEGLVYPHYIFLIFGLTHEIILRKLIATYSSITWPYFLYTPHV